MDDRGRQSAGRADVDTGPDAKLPIERYTLFPQSHVALAVVSLARLRLLTVPKTERLPKNSPYREAYENATAAARPKSYARLTFAHGSFSHTWKVSRFEIRATVRKYSLAKRIFGGKGDAFSQTLAALAYSACGE